MIGPSESIPGDTQRMLAEIAHDRAEVEAELRELEERREGARKQLDSAWEQLDALLFQFCELLRLDFKLDSLWHRRVFEGTLAFDVSQEQKILARYQKWAEVAERILPSLESSEAARTELSQATRFRDDLREVRGILGDQNSFFDVPVLASRQSAAIEADQRGETVEFQELGD